MPSIDNNDEKSREIVDNTILSKKNSEESINASSILTVGETLNKHHEGSETKDSELENYQPQDIQPEEKQVDKRSDPNTINDSDGESSQFEEVKETKSDIADNNSGENKKKLENNSYKSSDESNNEQNEYHDDDKLKIINENNTSISVSLCSKAETASNIHDSSKNQDNSKINANPDLKEIEEVNPKCVIEEIVVNTTNVTQSEVLPSGEQAVESKRIDDINSDPKEIQQHIEEVGKDSEKTKLLNSEEKESEIEKSNETEPEVKIEDSNNESVDAKVVKDKAKKSKKRSKHINKPDVTDNQTKLANIANGANCLDNNEASSCLVLIESDNRNIES